jgi:methylmalonyl-CoA epimerase
MKSNGFTVDHLGVAVRSVDGARKFYEMLGLKVGAEEVVEHERVRVAMVPVGDSRIELLEPTHPDSAVGKFLAKRGEGLHHVALRVPDLETVVARLREQGTRLISDEIRTGAGGHKYVFVHPASAGGVLLELVQAS